MKFPIRKLLLLLLLGVMFYTLHAGASGAGLPSLEDSVLEFSDDGSTPNSMSLLPVDTTR